MDELNERFKLVKEWTQLTPGEFAENIGVAQATVSHILNGRNRPSTDIIVRLCRQYPHINISWLLLGNGTMLGEAGALPAPPDDKAGFASGSLFTQPAPAPEQGNEALQALLANTSSAQAPRTEIIYKERPPRRITQVVVCYDDNTMELLKPEK
ncbi:MAG: helix-turn-helix domain-containing protein [Prevotellaceae bacterium]|jgi:plasmid maintenance system antidote protein VapI|nr:helix-turn-helix domain-containing protein [Prevotellaceae bacterium]